MAVKLYGEPGLDKPVMLCGWSGIGKVGLVAINMMRRLVRAERLGEIEPYGFLDPSHVVIREGLIQNMRFPALRLYSYHGKTSDIVLLVGEEQPDDAEKAYEMAGLVLDVADKLGCHRIYTSGASVTAIHHTAKPRVWAVPNMRDLVPEVRRYRNTVLMSEAGGTDGEGAITGLNGLLLGVARNRDIEAVCLMGEVPYYLQGAPWPYPKASISVLEVLGEILNVSLDLSELHETARRVQANIEHILEALVAAEELPEEVRREMENLRHPQRPDLGPITETEKKEILEHIDELFKGEVSNES